MRVFVTGVNGYIGAVLAPMLMERGLDVVGLDTGYYRDGWLYSDDRHLRLTPKTLNKDLREVTQADLEGCDAVVHLAELSNDPLGQNRPKITHDINHLGSVKLAELARAAGIRRFVYTSSCSVYGAGNGDFLDETSPPNPQSTQPVQPITSNSVPMSLRMHPRAGQLARSCKEHAQLLLST